MKHIPMIFNTEMVKALLAGRKGVTRRPMDPQPTDSDTGYMWWPSKKLETMVNIDKVTNNEEYWGDLASDICPIASIGDLIWVRETFAALGHNDYAQVNPNSISEIHEYRYKASERDSIANCKDSEVRGYKWVPSIYMPKSASRITLKVTGIRIERVQDITEDQAVLEGIQTEDECQRKAVESGLSWYQKPVECFKNLWGGIYNNWDENPYVWVIEFEVLERNVRNIAA
ncbi:hypothetical protein A1QO_02760 [Vibrio genomosp. F10 str. ZF-129]|uniref:ASCH domain-containing protein n=1 Tax=Vibrio genomosp. F10 str. ZF-129 TaxID=1187848 RepID=A0A1E5BK84_9VIBR|nr:hypothetical protein [Vibrio genomosp. F10]OEE38318.1 hypothetical protein A1QO_02760 [Vibrio genomosp. F10 str. ZF-129]